MNTVSATEARERDTRIRREMILASVEWLEEM
jgi:hypothetical protein